MNAQKNSISPYSQYGIGSIRSAKFIRNYGMAGLSYGLKSERHINPQNPASYHRQTPSSPIRNTSHSSRSYTRSNKAVRSLA